MTEQPTRYPRTFSGMLTSLGVLVVLVLGVVGFQALKQSNPSNPAVPVDYQAAAAYADGESSFTLAVPPSLPDGWVATSARYTPGADESWHLGLLTDGGHYVGIEQALVSPATLVRAHVDKQAVQGDDVTVNGVVWQEWSDSGGDVALVHGTPTVTTLVVGTVDLQELVTFVRSLPRASLVSGS